MLFEINEIRDFQTLRPVWNQLVENNVLGSNVFSTYEWLSTWWKHFGGNRRLIILTVEDKGSILGVAPLMLSKYRAPGFGSIRKVEFVAASDSDYSSFIILREDAAVIKAIMSHLLHNVPECDWIELKEISETTVKSSILQKFLSNPPSELSLEKRVCNCCPYLPLPDSFDYLLGQLDTKMLKNLRRRLKGLRENHRVGLMRFDEAGFSVNEATQIFTRLNSDRWESSGLPGTFGNNTAFRDFQLELAVNFAENGWLGLYFLMVDDEPVSAEYSFQFGNKVYAYLSGFDPAYSKYSVGNLIVMLLLERLIKEGFTEYDMLRGDEPYKHTWTSTHRQNFEIRLVRKRLLSKYYDWVTWSEPVVNLTNKLVALRQSKF